MKRFLISLLLALPVTVAQTPAPGSQTYIVGLKDGVRTGRDANPLPDFRTRHVMENLPIVTVDVTADELRALRNHPDVAYVAPDQAIRASSNQLAQSINADLVWSFGKTGTGVGVAVIDSASTL